MKWWLVEEHPERINFLKNVLYERIKDDSEDEQGNKVYIKERCERYAELMREKQREKATVDKRIERIVQENKRLKELGRPPIQVPPPFKIDKREI